MKTKTCSRCGKTKGLTEFSSSLKWITRISWCKECRRKDARSKYADESRSQRQARRSRHNIDLCAQRARRVNQSCRRRGIVGELTGDDVRSAFEAYRSQCWICGDPATEIDHFRPANKEAGGKNRKDNIRPICRACNHKREHSWHGATVATQEADLLRQLKALFTLPSPECSCSALDGGTK